jgi:hypothetical protein
MVTRPEQLYKDDFYAWTRDQAQALRRLAEERWNGPLDLEHLAEEVEELGMQARNAVRSQLQGILEHALKLEYSPAAEPRAGWLNSVDDTRGEVEARSHPRSAPRSSRCCRSCSFGLAARPRATSRLGARRTPRALFPRIAPTLSPT